MTINCRVANVTPDQALIWLGSVRNQSNINRRQVNAYAEDISAGRWKLNGEPIVISQNGVVLSGRLRLLACAASKASFPSLIVEGVQDFSFSHSTPSGVVPREIFSLFATKPTVVLSQRL